MYTISGFEYNYLKVEIERRSSKWIIGENDIVFITRKLGIINIEVKGKNCVFIYKPSKDSGCYFYYIKSLWDGIGAFRILSKL